LGYGSCSVIWKDSLIIFGGITAETAVQQYNFTTEHWKNLAPMEISHVQSACIILPQSQNEVFKNLLIIFKYKIDAISTFYDNLNIYLKNTMH